MTDIKEKQKLISDKNWVRLAETDTLLDFNTWSKTVDQIYFEADFILNFLMEPKIYKQALITAKSVSPKTVFSETIWRAVIKRRKNLNLMLTIQEWEDFLLKSSIMYNKKAIGKKVFIQNLLLDDKDENFIRALLDDTVYNQVLSNTIDLKLANDTMTNLSEDLLKNLSIDECVKVRDRITINGLMHYLHGGVIKNFMKN